MVTKKKQIEFLYKLQPTRPEMISEGATPEEEKVVDDHYHYLKGLTENGVIRLFGRTQNTDASTFGIVIFQTDSEESARTIVQNDPAIIAGVSNRVPGAMRAKIRCHAWQTGSASWKMETTRCKHSNPPKC